MLKPLLLTLLLGGYAQEKARGVELDEIRRLGQMLGVSETDGVGSSSSVDPGASIFTDLASRRARSRTRPQRM